MSDKESKAAKEAAMECGKRQNSNACDHVDINAFVSKAGMRWQEIGQKPGVARLVNESVRHTARLLN
jgi:hypothetical protein